jgi:hypothetical protein
MKRRTRRFQDFACSTREDVREHTYFNYSSTTTSMLILDNAVRRPATSSRGCTGSTSTTVHCCNIVSRPHQLIVDYFIDLSQLVSTNKLVENGCYALNN